MVDNCLFDGVTYGVLTDTVATDTKDIRIIGNRFINIYGDAIELNSPIKGMGYNRTPYASINDIVISNNFISVTNGTDINSGFGIGIAGATRVSITGNILSGCRLQAIHLEDYCKHVSIVGNVVEGGNEGIYIIQTDYSSIIGNEIYNCNGVGIHAEFNASYQISNSFIQGNTITACTGKS